MWLQPQANVASAVRRQQQRTRRKTLQLIFGSINNPVVGGRGRGAAAPTLETAEALLSPETAFKITRPALSPETAEALLRHYLGDEIYTSSYSHPSFRQHRIS